MKYSLKTRQICLFFLAFLPMTKLFIMPSIVAEVAKQDMWISSLINFAADFITVCVLLLACRKEKTNFYGILERTFGKTGSKIVLSFYFVYFILKAVLPITEQKDYVELTLYINRPSQLIFLPFFLIAFYMCLKKLRVIGRCADAFFLVSLTGLIFLLALSLGSFDVTALLPIGKSGLGNVFKGAYRASPWYGDCVYYMFFIGEYLHGKKDGIKILLSYFFAALLVFLFLADFYATFSAIAFRQRFALNEMSRYSTVINNIGRFDYLNTFFILITGVISLSLPIYFASSVLHKITGIKYRWACPAIVCALLISVLLFLGQYFAGIERFMTVYASAYFIFFGNLFPIIIALFRKKENKYEISQS